MNNIGEKIFNLRKEKGVSQEKLAFELGVSRQTVSKWELNIVQPNIENIGNICAYFGIKANYFLNDNAESEETATSVETTEVVSVEKSKAKEKGFKSLKIVLTVVGLVLLALLITACAIAVYVTASPGTGGVDFDVHVINYEAIIFLVIGIVATSILVTVVTLLIVKLVKNKRKKK